MTGAQWLALLPVIVAAAVPVTLMLLIAFVRRHALTAAWSIGGLVLLIGVLIPVARVVPVAVTPLLVVDGYALFFAGLMAAAAIATLLLAYAYLREWPDDRDELYLLVLTATLGAVVLVASSHFASFFLGLEIISVSLLALIAYPRHRRRPLEAAAKYLILSGASSAVLLFGIALLYARTGTLELAGLAVWLTGPAAADDPYLLAGTALLVAGIGFKLSLVPFHLWTPDVYEGAPAPVTAFLATVSKGAVFAWLLRYFTTGGYGLDPLTLALAVLAALSMLLGNLLALLQDDVKRILAYSSIAHVGYLLVAFLAAGELAAEAVGFYLAAYFVMTLGAFGIVGLVTGPEEASNDLDVFRGLFWTRPWVAGALTAMVLSLAGIPLTAGFVAKFYVFAAGVDAARWTLVLILVATSIVALFYYLRIVLALFAAPAPEAQPQGAVRMPAAGVATLVVLTVALVGLGVYPGPFIALLQMALNGLT